MSRKNIFFMIAALSIFPTRGFGQTPRGLADPVYKAGILGKVADLVESRYVLADKAKGFADAFRAKGVSGGYAALTDPKAFAAKVTADLVSITGDKHLNFRVIVPSAAGEQAVSTLHHPVRYSILRADENAGYFKLDWIQPRIGLLELRRFNVFGEAKELARAAMTFLAGARAVIVDVRENRGGSGDYLSSYFLPYPTQLSGSFTRSDGVLTEAWTRGDIGMEPRTDVPVFILIGPNTFSAAEAFAYDMKSRKRATLVGEPTGGGAHDTDLFVVDEQFEIYISTGRGVSPVTGGNWEGVGVQPDIRVPAAKALDAAVAEAKKAADVFGRAQDEKQKKAVEAMQPLADEAAKRYREGRPEPAAAALDGLLAMARKAGFMSEFFMLTFGYNFQSPEDAKMQMAVFEAYTKLFPDSREAWGYLAYVLESRGDKAAALRCYRQILALDPKSPNAIRKVKELAR
jgi:tetratricopeptide (TPR) repeat protein